MEKIYRELFSGVGAYGPEKMFTVAFADKKLTEQDPQRYVRISDQRQENIHHGGGCQGVCG